MLECAIGAAQTPRPNQPEPINQQRAVGDGDREDRYWTTNWTFRDIDLETLSERLKLFGLDVPVKIGGTATVNLQIGIPIDRPTNTRDYRLHGTLLAQDVQLDDVTVPLMSATVIYEDGHLKLTDFRGRTKAGTFAGSADAAINPRGIFQASLQVENLNIQPLVQLFGTLSQQSDLRTVTGIAEGAVKVSGNVDDLSDLTAWNATGSLRINDFSVGDSARYVFNIGQFSLTDQLLDVAKIVVTSPDHPSFFLRGNGELRLDAMQKFSVSLQANDLLLADFMGLYFPTADNWVEGKLDLKGTAQGELLSDKTDAPNISADLLVASPHFRLFGVDLGLLEHRLRLTSSRFELEPLFDSNGDVKREIDSISAQYSIDKDQITLAPFDAKVFGGSLRGSGVISRIESGVHKIDASWQDIEPSVLLPLPWLSRAPRLAGKTSGVIKWTVPAGKVNYPAFHQGKVGIEIDSMKLNGEDLGSVSAEVAIADSNFRLKADGDLLGGNIKLTSQTQLEGSLMWSEIPQIMLGGSLVIRQVSVGDAIRVFSGTANRRHAARLDAAIDFQLGPDLALQYESSLALCDWTVDQRSVSRLLTAKVSQTNGVINIESIEGDYAAGKIQVSGQWGLDQGKRLIHVRLVRARGEWMLLPITQSFDQWSDGFISGRATISGEGVGPLDGFRMVGSARINSGHVYGIPIRNGHSPFRIHFRPSPFQWDVRLPAVHATFASGTAQGSLRVSSHLAGAGVDLESRWRMTHVDFENLLNDSVGVGTIGRGDMNGDISLSGKRIQSVNDLRGRFHLTLAGTDATAVPGLSATASALGAISLSGVRFTSGLAKGQISQGAIQIEDFTMLSDRMKVQAAGRVFLIGPRMDLRGVIETGNFQGQEVLVRQFAPAVLGSLSPVTSVNQWLSDRTFVLDLHGHLRDPQVRLLAAETIQATARRRLTRTGIGLIISSAAGIGE